jgi:SIR2-like domain
MHVLLTGAGFSKNWDGRLADEFQQELASDRRVRDRSKLLRLVRDRRSFEAAYGIAHAAPYDANDRLALEDAIRDVFVRMDIDHSNIDRLNRINNTGVCRFISRFCPGVGQTGYFFTLNQDQLIERIFHPPVTAPDLRLPGIRVPAGEKAFGAWNWPIHPRKVELDPAAPPSLDRNFNYIKLHGSFNWQASGDGAPLVIGTAKEKQIAGHALLAWYFDIFARVLNGGNVRLMVIGYGFGDDHISRVIAEACRNSGLELFVWNAFSRPLEVVGTALGRDIIPSVSEVPLSQLFPSDQSTPSDLSRISNAFFGS